MVTDTQVLKACLDLSLKAFPLGILFSDYRRVGRLPVIPGHNVVHIRDGDRDWGPIVKRFRLCSKTPVPVPEGLPTPKRLVLGLGLSVSCVHLDLVGLWARRNGLRTTSQTGGPNCASKATINLKRRLHGTRVKTEAHALNDTRLQHHNHHHHTPSPHHHPRMPRQVRLIARLRIIVCLFAEKTVCSPPKIRDPRKNDMVMLALLTSCSCK